MDDVLSILLSNEPLKLPEGDYKVNRLSEGMGGDVIFRIRALREDRITEIFRLHDEDADVFLVLAGVISPDLKNQSLLDKYNASTPAELVKAMLIPGEIRALVRQITSLCGIGLDTIEEVKKN